MFDPVDVLDQDDYYVAGALIMGKYFTISQKGRLCIFQAVTGKFLSTQLLNTSQSLMETFTFVRGGEDAINVLGIHDLLGHLNLYKSCY